MRVAQVFRILVKGDRQTCEACGQSFVCGPALPRCWCASVKLSDQTRRRIRSQYQGCLCLDCLHKAASA